MRTLYSALWIFGLPLVLIRLAWRARKQPGALAHLGERFGRITASPGPTIWLHAVSVGETRAAEPLIQALLDRYPQHRILLTHMTATGRATGRTLFGKYGQVQQAWLPYDIPRFVTRFLRAARPGLGIVMETEVWPNLMRAATREQVPMLLANARLSERSARGYARLGRLARDAFAGFAKIAAQSEADAARLRDAGGRDVRVTGNVKYDVEIPSDAKRLGRVFRERIGNRSVILAASTREGEEVLILEAFKAHADEHSVLVIVPRHPQRFDDVAQLADRSGLALDRRSMDAAAPATTRVWLGDSMGEMAAYYAMADVTLMGGSWLDFGSQNLIESCAAGVPVLLGPSTYNFMEASRLAVEAGAARRCADTDEAMRTALSLLENAVERDAMSRAALAFCAQHGGATHRLLDMIRELARPE